MPDYQLPASIALAAVAAISASVNFATSKQEGKIRLQGPEGEQEYDPFDVTTPEDVAPGESIDGPQFWSRVCAQLLRSRRVFFHSISASTDSSRQVCSSPRLCRDPHYPNGLARLVGLDTRDQGRHRSHLRLLHRVISDRCHRFYSQR